ncbi:hypothetical protein GE061_018820 [Apolygus lucorum]|uniref:LRRCT domain-containing protein n=1 Tax=Apolygus lucorum TaxID=248454 RepID=A0A8S9X6D6_APOLU|nr:hypothetical protein GE061_018820 [Apolygus lucorum]
MQLDGGRALPTSTKGSQGIALTFTMSKVQSPLCNPLVCDCRLDWLHSLYNSSNSESVRTTIEEMTCIQSLNDLDSEPLRARMPDNSIGDSPTQDSMEPFSEKNFMAIPRESLPCPQDLRATGVPAVQLATKTESSGLKTPQSLVLIVLSVCLLFP